MMTLKKAIIILSLLIPAFLKGGVKGNYSLVKVD